MTENNIPQLSHGILKQDELHPAAQVAMEYVNKFITDNIRETILMLEAFENMSHSGDRLSIVCHESLRKVINCESIGERYLLGLAWTMRDMYEQQIKPAQQKKKKSKKPKKS